LPGGNLIEPEYKPVQNMIPTKFLVIANFISFPFWEQAKNLGKR